MIKEVLIKMLAENPDAVVALVHGYIEQYKPVVYGLCGEALEVAKDYVNNDDLYELRATTKKKAFDAYVKAGFSENQAIAFIINDNLQLMKNLKEMTSSSAKSSKTSEK